MMSGAARKIVFVTGPSGAGMSTATNALEDAGFEAIDNLPLNLVFSLLDHPQSRRPMSLGIDLRNRDFSASALIALLATLEKRSDVQVELLYLDCQPDVLLQRFSATRRRHPIADAPSLQDGIEQELELLRPVKARADVLIDTSKTTPHELRSEVEKWFAPSGDHQLALQIQSFSYKRGLPRGADFVFDCRFLQNPHWHPDLRPLDGRAQAVQDHVTEDPNFAPFFEKVSALVQFALPAIKAEGKSYLTVAFGCTGGKHRSVTLSEKLAAALAEAGWQVSIRHRELDRQINKGAV